MLTITPDLRRTGNSEGPSHATLYNCGTLARLLGASLSNVKKTLLTENLTENKKYPQKKTALVIHIFLKNSQSGSR